MSKLWILEALLTFSGKTFYLNLFESYSSSAARTPEMNPENTRDRHVGP
jgi:hypothetical protein